MTNTLENSITTKVDDKIYNKPDSTIITNLPDNE